MIAGLATALFLFIGPGLSVVLIPWFISRWQVKPSTLDLTWLKFVGVVLIVLGVCVVLDSLHDWRCGEPRLKRAAMPV
jgi:hypothetical protein